MNCKIEIIPRLLHFKQPAGTSRGTYTTRKVWYLHFTSPDFPGRVGIGECAPLPALSCDDLPDYEDILKRFCRQVEKEQGMWDKDVLCQYPSILFGLETAIWHFFAGSWALSDTAFSRGEVGIQINGLIWMGDFDHMLSQIEKKMEAGFRCVKLKIGAIDFEKELEESMKKIEEGDILTGTVISVDEKEVILDLKYYAEGVIPAENYSREPGFSLKDEVHEGDEVSATVVRKDDGQGNILLSRVEAVDVLAWDKLKELKESGEVLDVVVKGITNAGVIAYVEGVRGFIPASKLALNYVEDTEEYLNKPIQVQVLDVDKESKKLILSAKEILRAKAEEERKNKVSNLEIGLVTEGTVESLQPYGAFVNLGNGLSGLVHISQICEKRIKKPSEVLAVGDTVKVKVTAIKDGKLSLSIKEATDMMAKEIEEEVYEVPDAGEQATTSLGSLFANIKLD